MREYVRTINSFKPKFIRGYASSIYFFAKWIEENDLSIHSPVAVFTTSEKLFPHMRMKISEVFGCEVYDGYGQTDGGISAYECPEHTGLHIDTELGITEVVGPDRLQIDHGEGRLLATSLHNYALPFIRYDTGDDAYIIEDMCECGRGYKLLKEVIGRTVDVLVTPEGKNVHGWFFLYIFWENCKGIREYQVVQKTLNEIHIKLVIEDDFNDVQLERIKQIILSKSKSWIVKFQFVDKIERTRAGKYKFIINEVENA
jgi:phenylacetate-CoA ligase